MSGEIPQDAFVSLHDDQRHMYDDGRSVEHDQPVAPREESDDHWYLQASER